MVTFDYESEPKEEVHSCNLCGGTRFRPLSNVDRYGLPVQSVTCKACGLVFLNPRMSKEAYRRFYEEGTYRRLLEQYHRSLLPTASREYWQSNYANKIVGYLEGFCDGKRTLLDIGGSTGIVATRVADKYGLDPTVLEPSADEADGARRRGVRVIQAMLEDHDFGGERFDAVLLCQTIDHLLDIMGALRAIRGLLEDDGVFFVDAVWNTPIKVDHPFYLDDHTAPDYLRRAGFEVLKEHVGARKVRLNYVCGRA